MQNNRRGSECVWMGVKLEEWTESTGQAVGVDQKLGKAIEVNQKADTSFKRIPESGRGNFQNRQARHIHIHFSKVIFCFHATNSAFSQFLTKKWGFEKFYAPIIYKREEYPDATFISRSKEYRLNYKLRIVSNTCFVVWVSHTCFVVWVMFIVEDHILTTKCRTTIKAPFLYLVLCLSVILDSLSCEFLLLMFKPNGYD